MQISNPVIAQSILADSRLQRPDQFPAQTNNRGKHSQFQDIAEAERTDPEKTRLTLPEGKETSVQPVPAVFTPVNAASGTELQLLNQQTNFQTQALFSAPGNKSQNGLAGSQLAIQTYEGNQKGVQRPDSGMLDLFI